MAETALNVVAAIAIAAASSWITVQLSLRRFRVEKWWERKADAYATLVEALHNAKEFSDRHLDAAMEDRDISDEIANDLRKQAQAANSEIRKAASIGAFILSDEAVERVRKYQRDYKSVRRTTDWNKYLMDDYDAVSSCLEDIIIMAKDDLKMKTSHYLKISTYNRK